MKTYALAMILGTLVIGIFTVTGYYLFGENWTMKGFPIIGVLTGVVCWWSVKRIQQGK